MPHSSISPPRLSSPVLRPVLTVLLLAIAAPADAGDEDAAPISIEAKLAAAAIELPPDYQAAAVASEPLLANPVAFCFDPLGRIFIAETHRIGKGIEDIRSHMDWLDDDLASRTVADRRAYLQRRMGENISKFTETSELVRLIEDSDRDGAYDRSTVFSDGYNAIEDGAAAGVLWHKGRLLFTCIPTLWELADSDGDGRAEHKRALATGFGVRTAFFGHDMHGLIQGPDGKIYFSIGDRGLNVETPGGVIANPDSGAVLRCNPDGTNLELFAIGLRNPQELAFNDVGDLFTVDNSSDGGDRARLIHIVEGMDAGWRMHYQYLPDRGPYIRERIWEPKNDAQPAAIVPPLANISDGPSGLVYYPGTGLTADCRGAFFFCDFLGAPGRSGVQRFWVEPRGAAYKMTSSGFFARGVLATDCEFGPDGALYISDWVTGWTGTGKGRIHRIETDDPTAVAERSAAQQTIAGSATLPIEQLLPLLADPNLRVRTAAQRRLVALGAAAAGPLVKLAANTDEPLLARIHAIWALGELARSDAKLFKLLTPRAADLDPEIRAQVARTLGAAAAYDDDIRQAAAAAVAPLLDDASPRTRAMAAIAIGKLRDPSALPSLLRLAEDNNDEDPVLRHAAAMGLAGAQSSDALLAAADGASPAARLAILVALGRQRSPHVAHFLTDESQPIATEAARLIWDLPLPDAVNQLAALIGRAASLPEPALRRVIAANAARGTAPALEALIRLAASDAESLTPAIRAHIWELVRHFSTPSPRDPVLGNWRPLPSRIPELTTTTLRRVLPELDAASTLGAPGIIIAAELGVDEAVQPLVQLIDDPSLASDLRARAVAALSEADDSTLAPALDAALKSTVPKIRIAARIMMAQRFPDQSLAPLREGIAAGTLREKQSAFATLATLNTAEAHALIGEWLTRVEDGSCPPELMLDVLEAAASSSDASLVARQSELAAQAAARGPLDAFAACVEGGDPVLGQLVFHERSELSCRRCHSIKPGEQLVGPNLSDIGAQRSRLELLESIVAPNAKITEGFQTAALLMDTGKVVTGIVRREAPPHLLLVDPDGNEFAVELQAIEERSEALSAMPEGLAKLMAPRDLRDLVAFLANQKSPLAAGSAKPAQARPDVGHQVR